MSVPAKRHATRHDRTDRQPIEARPLALIRGVDHACTLGVSWEGAVVNRTWGYWTEQKLGMLAAYLTEFNRASQRVRRGTTYLDLFAGDTTNVSRTTGAVISGS